MIMKEFKTEKRYMHFLNFSKTSQNVFPECPITAANWKRNQNLLEADLFKKGSHLSRLARSCDLCEKLQAALLFTDHLSSVSLTKQSEEWSAGEGQNTSLAPHTSTQEKSFHDTSES